MDGSYRNLSMLDKNHKCEIDCFDRYFEAVSKTRSVVQIMLLDLHRLVTFILGLNKNELQYFAF